MPGTTYMIDFGPLQEVPSEILKKMQASSLHSRATGIANTMATGLDSASQSHYSRKLVASFDQPDTLGFVTLDALPGFDWRDREITVRGYFDPARDIRPGEAVDKFFAKVRFTQTFYTSNGSYTRILPGDLQLQVTALGALTLNKPVGFLFLVIDGTVQIKERS